MNELKDLSSERREGRKVDKIKRTFKTRRNNTFDLIIAFFSDKNENQI